MTGGDSRSHERRQVGPYLLKHEIGKGGFGSVFAAWHVTLRREAAVKIIHESADEPEVDEVAPVNAAPEIDGPVTGVISAPAALPPVGAPTSPGATAAPVPVGVPAPALAPAAPAPAPVQPAPAEPAQPAAPAVPGGF